MVFSVTEYLKLHNAAKIYLEYKLLPGIMFMFYNVQPFSLTLVGKMKSTARIYRMV